MNRKGFTLTEVLFVVVIAAVLIALIVPQGLRALANANYQADQSNLGSIEEASLVCWTETDPKSWAACDDSTELVPDYIETWPTSPCGTGGTYSLVAVTDSNSNTIGLQAQNSTPCELP